MLETKPSVPTRSRQTSHARIARLAIPAIFHRRRSLCNGVIPAVFPVRGLQNRVCSFRRLPCFLLLRNSSADRWIGVGGFVLTAVALLIVFSPFRRYVDRFNGWYDAWDKERISHRLANTRSQLQDIVDGNEPSPFSESHQCRIACARHNLYSLFPDVRRSPGRFRLGDSPYLFGSWRSHLAVRVGIPKAGRHPGTGTTRADSEARKADAGV
jgi:hypothetical protein